MKAVRIHQFGGPEVLQIEDIPTPEPGSGQARVRLEVCGVNFADVYQRLGQYGLQLPATPGQEGAGVVEAVGPSVTEVRPGDRVVYSNVVGSYAQYAIVPSWQLVPIPQGLDAPTAVAAMLQGMTAHYLVHDTFPLKATDTALVHAAAGGVGHLLVQMARRRGARVIAAVSTDAKAELAKSLGATQTLLSTRSDWDAEVKRLTDGRGVQVVYDSVGKDTFEKSLNCLALRGMMVLYGQASGPVPPQDPQILNRKGSLFLTRPTLVHYTHTREELLKRCGDVFSWVQSGSLRVRLDRRFSLAQAAEAHRYLQSRQATGKVLLVP